MRSYGVYLAHGNGRCVEIKFSRAAFNRQLFKGQLIFNVKSTRYVVLLLISTFLLLTACEPAKDLQDHANKNPNLQETISIETLFLKKRCW